jgi:adenine specific DNA methylase Mod
MPNRLYFGDNLEVLREHIKEESVDLVYLDPPFNSNATYNVLFKEPTGDGATAQAQAFCDTWQWGPTAAAAYEDVMQSGEAVSLVMRGLRDWLGRGAMMAYLTMMAARLIELRRVLKSTGSIYLHCDPTASHYLKVLMDAIFGHANFRNEICWKRSSSHADGKQGMKRCGRIHDTILFYAKSEEHQWNPVYTPYDDSYLNGSYKYADEKGRRYREGDLTAAKPGGDVSYEWRVKRRQNSKDRWQPDLSYEFREPRADFEYLGVKPYKRRFWAYSKENLVKMWESGQIVHRSTGVPQLKRYLDEQPGVPLQDLWLDINPLTGGEKERLNYPTQKPASLLERIIRASSSPGDVILDPFCGCGTTVDAAESLGRQWVGIDITHYAVTLIENRLKRRHPNAKFAVYGRPADFNSARDLARRDKHQFQWWAAWFAGAQSYREEKKGADRGIDGNIVFANGPYGHGRIIISVKGGENVGVQMVRDLRGVIEREEAEMGVLVTLVEPTGPMVSEAAAAGFVKKSAHGRLPKLQIISVSDLFDGRQAKLPPLPQVLTGIKSKRRQVDPQLSLLLAIPGSKTLQNEGAFVDPRYIHFGK